MEIEEAVRGGSSSRGSGSRRRGEAVEVAVEEVSLTMTGMRLVRD